MDTRVLIICRLYTNLDKASISVIPYSRKNSHPTFCKELVALAKNLGVEANGKKASTDLSLAALVLVGPGEEMFHSQVSSHVGPCQVRSVTEMTV